MSEPRVIVALDFATAKEALAFVDRLAPSQCRLKVGLELFTAAGPGLVCGLVERGFDVFLDLKFHDIPTTVARACSRAAGLGVWMLNVHALGGEPMLAAAREAVNAAKRRPLLIAVTVLTSHDDRALAAIGLQGDATQEAARLASLAQAQGLDGVVCSGHEAATLRQSMGSEFLLVTPGIRPGGSANDDQRRTVTPIEAIRSGADYLVIGRPVTQAKDPVTVLERINHDIITAMT